MFYLVSKFTNYLYRKLINTVYHFQFVQILPAQLAHTPLLLSTFNLIKATCVGILYTHKHKIMRP